MVDSIMTKWIVIADCFCRDLANSGLLSLPVFIQKRTVSVGIVSFENY